VEEETCSCSFCGKSQKNAKKLIASPGGEAFICDECIAICREIIKEEDNKTEFEKIELPTPMEIKNKLDDYIVGQDEAKRVLAVAVYNHYKRINYNFTRGNEQKDFDLEKSNILMVGPTGSGKTLLAKTLANILQVPFAVSDATTLTEAGYVGDDVENILLKLIQNADYDIAKAQRGIVYIDEIDKIARKTQNVSITRDVGGEGVQQALLKIMESTVANVPPQGGRKHPHQDFLQIDTTDILFICGGAFDGLDEVVKRRIGSKTLGFEGNISEYNSLDSDNLLMQAQPQDFVKYGLIPELVGRLPIMASLKKLDEEALINILTKPKNALIKQYKYLLKIDGVDLTFNEEAIHLIAQETIKRGTGARGLRSILENIMLDIMYMAPDDKELTDIVITKDIVEKAFLTNEQRKKDA